MPVPIELGFACISVNFYRDDILILKEGLSLNLDVEHPLDVKHPILRVEFEFNNEAMRQ